MPNEATQRNPRRGLLGDGLLPLHCMFQPARAGTEMARSCCWPVFLWLPATIGGLTVVVGGALWAQTLDAYGGQGTAKPLVADILSDIGITWGLDDSSEMSMILSIFVAMSVLIIVGFGSLCMLPSLLDAQSVQKAWTAAIRLSVGSLGPSSFLIALIAVVGALADNMIDLVALHGRLNARKAGGLSESCVFLLFAASTPLVCLWWSRAATAFRLAREATIELSPTCEGCGYNLTHRPDIRCPECGLATAASLDPDLARPGPSWLRSPGVTSWLETTFDVIATPGSHYSRLPVHGDERQLRTFGALHCVIIGLVTAPTLVLVKLAAGGVPIEQAWPSACAAAILAGTLAWMVNRALGGLAMSAWSVFRTMPDIGAGRRVIACETAFFWPVLFCNLLMSLLLAADPGTSVAWGGLTIHLGIIVPGGGNAALVALWLWRYRIAGRAIRWSNF